MSKYLLQTAPLDNVLRATIIIVVWDLERGSWSLLISGSFEMSDAGIGCGRGGMVMDEERVEEWFEDVGDVIADPADGNHLLRLHH